MRVVRLVFAIVVVTAFCAAGMAQAHADPTESPVMRTRHVEGAIASRTFWPMMIYVGNGMRRPWLPPGTKIDTFFWTSYTYASPDGIHGVSMLSKTFVLRTPDSITFRTVNGTSETVSGVTLTQMSPYERYVIPGAPVPKAFEGTQPDEVVP